MSEVKPSEFLTSGSIPASKNERTTSTLPAAAAPTNASGPNCTFLRASSARADGGAHTAGGAAQDAAHATTSARMERRSQKAIHGELVRKRRNVHAAGRHDGRRVVGKIAEVVARRVLLRAVDLDAGRGIEHAQDAWLPGLVGGSAESVR